MVTTSDSDDGSLPLDMIVEDVGFAIARVLIVNPNMTRNVDFATGAADDEIPDVLARPRCLNFIVIFSIEILSDCILLGKPVAA